MIHQLDMYGRDMVETAIGRLKIFEPKDGYYLAFSGGKDSIVVKALCDMAGVKYDAHYSVTTVDPPELIYYIRKYHPDVEMVHRRWETDGRFHKEGDIVTMWNLIPENSMPPTRLARYCCQYLKEPGGFGRKVVTGVRWAESANRKNNAGIVKITSNVRKVQKMAEKLGVDDIFLTSKGGVVLNNDNEETRKMVEHCYIQSKTTINPIVDWEDSDVWEFIREYKLPYCELYDKGYKRLGCIGCPMANKREELEAYPKFRQAYLKAFERMLIANKEKGIINRAGWETAEDVMRWWLRE